MSSFHQYIYLNTNQG